MQQFAENTWLHSTVPSYTTGLGLEPFQCNCADANLWWLGSGGDGGCRIWWFTCVWNRFPGELRYRWHMVHRHKLSGGLSESILLCRLGARVDQDPHL